MITLSILTHNKVDFTKRCIQSILKNTPEKQLPRIVVSDNGSTDSTIEYLESVPQVVLIKNVCNVPFSIAHNNIIKSFDRDDIILMNNDIEVSEGWLSKLHIAAYENDYAAVSPAIQTPNGLDVGAILNDRAQGRSLINDFEAEPDWITGSCIYIQRNTITNVKMGNNGLLDENFKFYYEDVDYCKRIKNAGLKFKCIKDVVIKHNDSTSSTPQQKRQMLEESRKYFVKKWGYKE